MIIKINYNKSTGAVTITDDEATMEAAVTQIVDNDNELSFEIPLNVSAYQTQFEEIEIDGNNN
jgi:hypothetical protein|tara:strand:- start:1709 stop:1897 length:189 start_codon:yes stop_codon:yes gene_type:complete